MMFVLEKLMFGGEQKLLSAILGVLFFNKLRFFA